MIVLDTTVLLQAVGGDHPLREPCRSLIEAIAADRVSATTTAEVLQESAYVRARRRTRGDAVGLAKADGGLLQPLLAVEDIDLHDGLDIYDGTDALGPFDCVPAAVARRHGARAFVSAERGFPVVPGFRVVDPPGPGLPALVA